MLEDMGAVEQRVFRTYWDDGLLDLFAAIGVLTIGLFWLRDLPVGAVFVPVWLVPIWGPVRRRYIEPRLGMVEFTEQRERRNTLLLKLLLYAGIACLILGIETYFFRDRLGVNVSNSLVAGLPAFLLAIMAVITTVLVVSSRFLVYAAVLLAAGIFGAANDWRPGLILATAGLIMLGISIGVLARFFRENPYQPEDAE